MSDDNSPIKAKPERSKYLILLAEDDPSIAQLLKMELTNAGYKNLIVAENGQIASDTIQQDHPKVVLMDINMPVMTGINAIEEVKKSGYAMSSFKLFFLANSSSQADIDHAHALNGEYKIKADLTPKDLVELLDKALSI